MITISEIQDFKLRAKAQHWLSIFEDWQKSSLSKTQYYKLHNIGPSSAYYWFKYLQGQAPHPYSDQKKPLKKKTKGSQLKFLAVERTPDPGTLTQGIESSFDSGLKIVLTPRLFLAIEKNFDAISLGQVLSILEDRCS